MRTSEVRYTRIGDDHVAYRVIDGSQGGDRDIVLIGSGTMSMESFFDDAVSLRVLEGLSDLGRLVVFDRRGIGLSDAASSEDGFGFEIRIGIHAGDVDRRGDDLSGITVHIAARVSAAAASGEVLVSETVPRLVSGASFAFVDRGEHVLKGVPEPWRLFAAAR